MKFRKRALLLFVVVAAPFMGFAAHLQHAQDRQLERHSELVLEQLTERVQEMVGARLALVSAMAREMELGELEPGAPLARRSATLQQLFDGYQAINYITADGIIQQVSPVESNRGALGRDVSQHPQAAPVFLAARETGLPRTTSALELFQGGRGFASYIPVDGGRGGFLNAVFRVEPLLAGIVDSAVGQDFALSMEVDGQPLLSRGDLSSEADHHLDSGFSLYGSQWALTLEPTPSLVSSYHSQGTPLLIFAGLLLAAGSAIFYLQLARSQEERRKHAAALERVRRSEALGTLAGGMAHDFSNLLTALRMGLEGVRHERDPRIRAEDTEAMIHMVEQGTTLTAQLKRLSRAPTGATVRFDPQHELMELSRLLKRVMPRSVQIIPDLDGGGELQGDPGAFQRAIVNLAVNARDAMDGRGRIWLRSRRSGSWFVVEVQDEGQGMTEQVRQRAFDPYFTTKPHTEGTGLGLAMVMRTVQDMHGTVRIQSREGDGTCIVLRFPLGDPRRHAPPLQLVEGTSKEKAG